MGLQEPWKTNVVYHNINYTYIIYIGRHKLQRSNHHLKKIAFILLYINLIHTCIGD